MNLTPDPIDIVQSEEEVPALQPLPTYVCGPVETRELPGIRGGYSTATSVGTSMGIRLLTLEPRRKSAVIMPVDQDIWISSSQAGAQSGSASAFRVPASVPFVIDHMDEVWACSVTSTTDISVMTTYWSE